MATKMEDENKPESSNSIHVRKPKRVIYCSDGVYEEYSSDEEEVKEDPKDMSLIRRIGHSIVFGLDYVGEGLANILNISTPKYAYEIEQFKKMEEERQKEEQHERENTWELKTEEVAVPITEVPKKNESSETN